MKNKKYELRKELPLIIGNKTLYRIRALKDFTNAATNNEIHKGDLGGYVIDESILSQDGTCWISKAGIITIDGVKICDDAYVDSLIDFSATIINGTTRLYAYNTCSPISYTSLPVYRNIKTKNLYLCIEEGEQYEDDENIYFKLIPLAMGYTIDYFSIESFIYTDWEYDIIDNKNEYEIYMHEKISNYLKENDYNYEKLDYNLCAVYNCYSNSVIDILK